MNEWRDYFAKKGLLFDVPMNGMLRGVGQVMFMDNPLTGLIMLITLFAYNPGRTGFGLIGSLVAHLGALFMGFDQTVIKTGYFGYNGFMVGMALTAFIKFPPIDAWSWWMLVLYTFLVSLMSAILMVAFANIRICDRILHPATYPFSVISLMAILMALKFNRFPVDESFVPVLIAQAAVAVDGRNVTTSDWEWNRLVNPGTLNFADVMVSSLRGVSQIYLCNDEVAAVFIIIAIAFTSRISAVMAFVGSLVGVGTAQFMGVAHNQILEGIWGYCGALAGATIGGVFYVFTLRSFLFAIFGAVVATFINAALASFLSPYGTPTMSFGFLFTHTLYSLIQPFAKGLVAVPLDKMTYAEDHLRKYRNKGGAEEGNEDGL